jgi:predicted lipoprotein with Yx(FWY)xxD motif
MATGCSGQAATYGQQGAEAAQPAATTEPASPVPPTAAPADASTPQPGSGSSAAGSGYSGGYGYGAPAATSTVGQGTSASEQVTVGTATSSLGLILVDGRGRTLYALTTDSPGVSTCEGSCLANWPPLVVSGTPVAGSGVEGTLLGTMTRSDGSTQVTYNGKPLYTFVGDVAAGDVNGQGKAGVWFAVTALGDYAR